MSWNTVTPIRPYKGNIYRWKCGNISRIPIFSFSFPYFKNFTWLSLMSVDHFQVFDPAFEVYIFSLLWKDSIIIVLLFIKFTDCLIQNFVKSNMIDLRLKCGLNWSHIFAIFLFLLYIFPTLGQFYNTHLLLLSKQRMRYLHEFSQQHLAFLEILKISIQAKLSLIKTFRSKITFDHDPLLC